MSSSDQRTNLKVVTVGDFDPQADHAIEYDFIGRVIAGRYTVQAQIGGGGMADVFRATDEELGVDVAIKLLKPRMASDELRARMVQEAQAAAQVRHANLVRVFSTGKLDRTAYIVMELLDGPNLEQYLREHPDQRLPWNEALTLMLPALDALHAIHERGYIHRDIKAGNILVTREPGCLPMALVIDLGLVKADRALRTVESPATTEGRLLCTPSYASPEQAAGLPLDRRSDIYSMAVTLYRVLAGRLPFHDARGKSAVFVLDKHIFDEPTLLAEAATGADVPPAIAAVIESALRKDPNERPPTMRAFAEALRAAATSPAAGAPAIAAPPRRRPYELLLGLGLGVVVTWMAIPRPASLQAASCPTVAAPVAPMIDSTVTPVPAPVVPDAEPATDPPGAAIVAVAPPASEVIPGPPAPPVADNSASPTRRRLTLKATWHRALAQRTSEVQRCADQATGSLERLAVAVNIDTQGRVFAHVKGAPDSPLSRCLSTALKQTPLTAPRESTSIVHVFQLRVTPDP